MRDVPYFEWVGLDPVTCGDEINEIHECRRQADDEQQWALGELKVVVGVIVGLLARMYV